MRINIYSQEITDEFRIVEKTGKDGETFTALMLMMNSSSLLHQPPEHTGDDDDRGAVTFWLPKSINRREKFAQSLEMMAAVVRAAKSEDPLPWEDKARELAGIRWDKTKETGHVMLDSDRESFINSTWHHFEKEAQEALYGKPGHERVFVESNTHQLWRELRNNIDEQSIRLTIAALEERVRVCSGDEDTNISYVCGQQDILAMIKEALSPNANLPDLTTLPVPARVGDLTEAERHDPRIDLMLLFLQNLYKSPQTTWKKDELRIWFINTIYLMLKGNHDERLFKMSQLDIPKEE